MQKDFGLYGVMVAFLARALANPSRAFRELSLPSLGVLEDLGVELLDSGIKELGILS